MTTLSSLIVARHAASIAQVDEALAQQVVRGGDLPTSLLELGVIEEAALVSLVAETFGVEAAAPGEIATSPPEVLRLVPRDVAQRFEIYPLREREGELWVAVAEPLPQAVEEDLGIALGARLHQQIALAVRIRQAMMRDYGLSLDRRFLRLLARLEHRPDPTPSMDPPRDADRALDSPEQRVTAPAPRRKTWPGMPSSEGRQLPLMQGPSDSEKPEPISSRAPTARAPSHDADSVPPVLAVERKSGAAPPADFLAEAAAATALQVEKKRRRKAERGSGKVLAGWARKALGNTIPSDQAPHRRRGPVTAAAAEQELEEAYTGEQALTIFFGFARQYFEYSALFSVHGDLAAGHDAWGSGASRKKVRAIGVALDLPSALSQARSRAVPILVKLKRGGLDGDLRADLGRSAMHDVLVLPVMMRSRCVALLYADDGDQSVSFGDIGEVIAVASLLAAALERILLRKKRAALRTSAPSGKIERPRESASAPAATSGRPSEAIGALASIPSDLSELVERGTNGPEEDTVDEGWSLPDGNGPLGRDATSSSRSPPAPSLGGEPVSVEDEEPPPEVTFSELGDATEESLLEELERHDSSPAAGSVRAASTPDEMRRSLEPLRSSSVAVAPRTPPQSRTPFRELPSVLIRSELVDQVIAGGARGESALSEILALGEAAIPSVFARFPGPLTVERSQALGELPGPADCGPVLRIVAAMRRLALPFLAVRSGDADVDVRFWATYLLGDLCYVDAATALFPRLFDENPAVRRIALRSARALVAAGEEGAPLRNGLERMVGDAGEPLQRRLTALGSIRELKIYRSIPALIGALSDPMNAVAEAAVRALVALTREEFGRDAGRWKEWWERKGRQRLT